MVRVVKTSFSARNPVRFPVADISSGLLNLSSWPNGQVVKTSRSQLAESRVRFPVGSYHLRHGSRLTSLVFISYNK